MRNQNDATVSGVTDSGIAPHKVNKNRLSKILYIAAAFICSIILWFYVIGYNSPDYQKVFTGIKIDVVGRTELFNSKGYTVTMDGDYTIDVTVRGKKADVVKLKNSDIVATVDVSALENEGEQDIAIEVNLPNGINLVEKSTDFWAVIAEKKTAKTFEIEVTPLNGAWDTDYEIEFSCTPGFVTVEGSKRLLDSVDKAVVLLDLGKIENPTTAKGIITLLDKGGNVIDDDNLKLSVKNVSVYISLIMTKEVPIRVEFTAGVFSVNDAQITCNPSVVTVKGSKSKVSSINEIVIGVDETTLNGSTIIEFIPVPEEVELVGDKKNVHISAALVDVASRIIEADGETAKIIGLPKGLGAKVLTEKLSVHFKGYTGSLRTMTAESFAIVVDMSAFSIEAGSTYRVPVSIVVNSDVVGVFTTDEATIELLITTDPS